MFFYNDAIDNPIVSMISVGLELRNSPDYYFDNAAREIDCYMFQYTLAGSGTMEISGKRHKILPGQAIFADMPSDTKYYFSPQDDHEWWFIYVMFQGKAIHHYFEQILAKTGYILNLDYDSPIVQKLVEFILDCKGGKLPTFSETSTFCYEFLNELYAYYTSNLSHYSARTAKIIQDMNTNYGQIESIQTLADKYKISTYHLTREFKEEVGIAPIKYLTNVRMEQAKQMLLTTNRSVQEIARMCGYSRSNYFIKAFREHVGTTPMQYRMR